MRRIWTLAAALAICLLAADCNTVGGANFVSADSPTPVDPFRPTPPLEQRPYIHNLTLLAQHFAGEERGEKMQMMAIGDRRYLVQSNRILDISDPMRPTLMAEGPWRGNQIQVAYHAGVGKWIVLVSQSGEHGGVAIYDLSDPRHPTLLSRWEGGSTHRNYYDGGRYAYLSASPGDDYYTDRNILWGGSSGILQIIDVSDPAAPRLVSNWHFPGQRAGEVEERRRWSSANDRGRIATMHGGFYVPVRVEDGGRYGYGPWGALGMMIHDVSDPAHPRLVSHWEPERYVPGALPFHTVDVSRLDRGFVITNPEPFWPQCREPWHHSYIIDVTNPEHPRQIATLPVPQPPPEAPYRSFCERYGRFGTHNAPHLKAPGHVAANFTCYSFFAAGLQCYDLSNPSAPRISAYFVPVQGGPHAGWEVAPGPMGQSIRTVDNVFIEWDRRLIWVASDSGLYVLSSPDLGEPVLRPMPVREWTLPSINQGFENFRPQGR